MEQSTNQSLLENTPNGIVGPFGQVGGYFYCSNNQLTSLEGCPTSVGGYFYCTDSTDLCKNSFIETLYLLISKDWFLKECLDKVQGIRMKLIKRR